MGHSIFVTGTDTGVGKTFFTTGIIRMLKRGSVDVVGFKPIECGGRSDSKAIREASGNRHSLDEINPVWLDQPLAPLAAADSPEDLRFDLIKSAHQKLVDQHELVIVEGAGGWLVPLTPELTMADLAAEMCDEVIIVAANRLGVINHTLLTYRSIMEKKMDCARMILNHLPTPEGDSTGYSQPLYPVESFSDGVTADMSLASNARTIQQCLPGLDLFPLHDENCFTLLAESLFAG